METTYEEIKLHFNPGDILFFCSDGVVEARNPVPFGKERLKEIIHENRCEPSAKIADAVVDAVMEHVSGEPNDDISLVVLKCSGEQEQPR
jgi:serine phosphatase RsbU (regulator of sigma subunit)